MRARVQEHGAAVAVAVLTTFVVSWLALYGWVWTDYDDEARPAFDALVNGHVLHFLQLSPAYGGSLVLRAPFVLLTRLWHGGELSIYRMAAAPCLFASAAFGVWLVARMRTLGRARAARIVALLLCVANPITLPALEKGHPEELLGAVLAVGAVLVANRNRPIWAGVLLGLAIANKEWAILAVGPVLFALPDRRPRALLSTAAVAAVVLAPLILAGTNGFVNQAKLGGSAPSSIFQPWQVWWFLGSHGHIVHGLFGTIKVGYRMPPGWIETIAHPLIVVIALPLTLLYARVCRRGLPRPRHDPLLLLVLLLLLRCVLDPWDNVYYPLPCLFALLAWETLSFDRVPVLALVASFATWFVFQATSSSTLNISADMQSLIFLAFAIPAVAVTLVALYVPDPYERVTGRMRRRAAIPSPA
jgi:hypothetical protein